MEPVGTSGTAGRGSTGSGSTGGGFKVSTFMTLLTRAGASFRGQLRANFAKRTIPERAVERATATALVFVAIAIAALVVLLVVENDGLVAKRPRWFLDALFEVISALGTVGLSTGITPDLSLAGKTILIALMLLGRLGPITVAVALSRQRPAYQEGYLTDQPDLSKYDQVNEARKKEENRDDEPF